MNKYLINLFNIILSFGCLIMYFFLSSSNLNIIIEILLVLIFFLSHYILTHKSIDKNLNIARKILLLIYSLLGIGLLLILINSSIYGLINMYDDYVNIAGLLYVGAVVPYLLIRVLINSCLDFKNKRFNFPSILYLISLIVITITLFRILTIIPIYSKFGRYTSILLEQNVLLFSVMLLSSLISSYKAN